jgi:prevent-host-death family protein
MKRTSITDAKNGLSALIERVRHGESIIIEDRGVPVARLESVAAPGRRDVEGRAARLQRQGVLRPPLSSTPKRVLTTPPPTPSGGAILSDAVIAERRDGR